MKPVRVKPEHEIAYQEIAAMLKRHADEHNLSSVDLLAVLSNMLGKLIAMQDQRAMTTQQAMDIVARNIELGNQQVLAQIGRPKGHA